MSDTAETKICPMCAETIKAAAKVCPHCRTRQGRFTVLKGELPGAAFAIAMVAGLMALLMWLTPDETDKTSGRGFRHYRRELVVARTALELTGTKPDFWLTGYVTNNGNHPWRVHELEVRFLDPQGKMVDVQHPDFSKAEAFVVQPGQEHAFRILLDARVQTNTSTVHTVRVQIATDGQQPCDPD